MCNIKTVQAITLQHIFSLLPLEYVQQKGLTIFARTQWYLQIMQIIGTIHYKNL